jgi:hypothetical protein
MIENETVFRKAERAECSGLRPGDRLTLSDKELVCSFLRPTDEGGLRNGFWHLPKPKDTTAQHL